jgi:adenylylsulfate reductase subunit B
MTVIVDIKKCNGCRQLDEPQCRKLCPGDLMQLDQKTDKAYINVKSDCWDCMVCVKACPMRAIETRLPYKLAPYSASLRPRKKKNMIEWELKDSDGMIEKFNIKTGVS